MVSINSTHPSIGDHFPGNPVVPGVVILGEVLEAIRHSDGGEPLLLELPEIKFFVPLVPDEAFCIQLGPYMDGGRTFACVSQGNTISSGRIIYQVSSAILEEST